MRQVTLLLHCLGVHLIRRLIWCSNPQCNMTFVNWILELLLLTYLKQKIKLFFFGMGTDALRTLCGREGQSST